MLQDVMTQCKSVRIMQMRPCLLVLLVLGFPFTRKADSIAQQINRQLRRTDVSYLTAAERWPQAAAAPPRLLPPSRFLRRRRPRRPPDPARRRRSCAAGCGARRQRQAAPPEAGRRKRSGRPPQPMPSHCLRPIHSRDRESAVPAGVQAAQIVAPALPNRQAARKDMFQRRLACRSTRKAHVSTRAFGSKKLFSIVHLKSIV